MHGTQSVGQPAVESSDILQAELDHEWREYKDTHLEPVDFSALVQEAERTLLRAQAAQHPSQYPSGGNPANAAPAPAQSPALAWPPGNAGLIAQVIYNSSLRPVKEVSITATLGLLAGVCGRAWTLPKSGLNLYVVLIARSAIGKEAMHDGISMFIRGASKYFPQVSEFFDFNEYASGPALVKALAASPCFCFTNVSSEFGRKLKKMKNGKDDASQSLRTQMTNLYHKSGRTSIAGGISYSNTQNNVSSTVAIAYSMIGESTPGTFREALTPDMMEDGFLSRLTIIEHTGERPEKNLNSFEDLPDEWAKWFATLAWYSKELAHRDQYIPVACDEDAGTTFILFEKECDGEINKAGDDEARRQVWNRAALKSVRIAALLAVADNHVKPMVGLEHAQWAIDLIRRDIALFLNRLDSGDIGEGNDDSRRQKVLACMREWITKELPESYRKRKGWEEMRQNSILPRTYLSIRFHTLPAFANHKLGKDAAIDLTLASLVRDGYLMEVKKDALGEAYNFHGVAHRILRLE